VRKGIISTLGGKNDIRILGQVSNKLELIVGIDKLSSNIVNYVDTNVISILEGISLINQEGGRILCHLGNWKIYTQK
jgi:hypothetical protein